MPIYPTGEHANHASTTVNHPAAEAQSLAGAKPFSLQDKESYRRWREQKLHAYPETAESLIVEVGDPRALTEAEAGAILRVCRKSNMAIYTSPVGGLVDKTIPRALGERFGLQRLDSNMLADDDGISSLQVVPGKSRRGYIPYSNRRLLWHTDGYYNSPESFIRAFVLHCVSPAAEGGENSLLDHEIVYILLRDASIGPVFSVDIAGNLHMRYTARTRSILWKQDAMTQEAVRFLENLLNGDSPYVFHHRLAPGQGLICNNVLHNRTGFTDDMDKGIARLVYRARYYDRIRGTNFSDMGV
jgi:Taurine catabolism dioxygenase TauD, TfdA family